jgi:hypothetical protein
MGNKIKLSPIIIIVILVVVVAMVGLIATTLSGSDGVINHLENKSEEIIPTIETTLSSEEADQEKVVITVVASTDDADGIDSIVLPDGTIVNGSSKDYTVTENGTYEFSTIGKNGKKATAKVVVSNIKTISAENPYIPDGFEYIGGEVDSGYVIQDSVGNQFVWIPVPTGILTRNTMLNSDYEESNATSSELVNSVAKYYGFYIARFEASSYEIGGKKVATSLAGRIPWTNVTYTEAYQAALDMASAFNYEEGIKTAIVNSYALDTTLDWINETVENYSTNISFGNYSGTILPTGQTESDIVNNICDLAGNVREWTTEIDKSATNSTSNKDSETADANSLTKRIVRGGSANLSRTASARTGNSENLSDGYWGFRTILYK